MKPITWEYARGWNDAIEALSKALPAVQKTPPEKAPELDTNREGAARDDLRERVKEAIGNARARRGQTTGQIADSVLAVL